MKAPSSVKSWATLAPSPNATQWAYLAVSSLISSRSAISRTCCSSVFMSILHPFPSRGPSIQIHPVQAGSVVADDLAFDAIGHAFEAALDYLQRMQIGRAH